ncbi:MAG: antibiotic biosynthesis monooxygenase [Gammaproteobacteria bacterium]
MNDNDSVTVVVTRRVMPGRKQDYLDWVRRIGEVARRYPGHQGTTSQVQGDDDKCHVVFRFDTIEHLRAWEESPERAEWVAKLEGIVEGDSHIERLTGLEVLFAGQPYPKAHKMALVLTVAIFVLVVSLNPLFLLLAAALPAIPAWLLILIKVAVQVLLLVYFIMPRVTRWLAPWLAR